MGNVHRFPSCRHTRLAWLVVLLFPSVAHANTITRLMAAEGVHLFCGNLVIGVAEGLLIAALCKTPRIRSVVLLVLANYLSAWLGGLWLLSFIEFHIRPTITDFNLVRWLFISALLAFIATILIEFPFFLLSFGRTQRAFRRAIKATFLINIVSYLGVIALYFWASEISLVAGLTVVNADQMGMPPGYSLYYISCDGTSVMRSDLLGRTPEKIRDVPPGIWGYRLFAQQLDDHHYDLFALEHDEAGNEKRRRILADFSRLAPIVRRPWDGLVIEDLTDADYLGVVQRLDTGGDWEYHTGYFGFGGITGWNNTTDDSFHYALDTPLCAWRTRNAVCIEGGFLVLQVGDDQICALHPQKKQIALITRGRGPLVAMDR